MRLTQVAFAFGIASTSLWAGVWYMCMTLKQEGRGIMPKNTSRKDTMVARGSCDSPILSPTAFSVADPRTTRLRSLVILSEASVVVFLLSLRNIVSDPLKDTSGPSLKYVMFFSGPHFNFCDFFSFVSSAASSSR